MNTAACRCLEVPQTNCIFNLLSFFYFMICIMFLLFCQFKNFFLLNFSIYTEEMLLLKSCSFMSVMFYLSDFVSDAYSKITWVIFPGVKSDT